MTGPRAKTPEQTGRARIAADVKQRAAEHKELLRRLKTSYKAGNSIRDIAAVEFRSYGYIRDHLLEAGVTLRARNPKPKKAKAKK